MSKKRELTFDDPKSLEVSFVPYRSIKRVDLKSPNTIVRKKMRFQAFEYKLYFLEI